MRITHRRKKDSPKKIYFFNEGITAPQVMVLDAAGANLGIKITAEAMRMARAESLDLVEINPKTTPPVAKIMNFGQFRYQQEKDARLAKAHQHVVETKGIRLSLRIGQHDLDIRKNQAMKFLNDGDKVRVELIMRGRELQQAPMAFEIVKIFINQINTVVPIRSEQNAERQANKVTAIIAKS